MNREKFDEACQTVLAVARAQYGSGPQFEQLKDQLADLKEATA